MSVSSSSQPTNLPASPSTLDTLLIRYLDLLHTYQTTYLALTSHLSSGYISLAAANFTAPSHVRYNQDYYDARMQASTKIEIKPGLVGFVPAFHLAQAADTSADPLRWFGIFTPAALHTAQTSFRLALTDAVPSLASVLAQIRHVEAQVRALKAEGAGVEVPAEPSGVPAHRVECSNDASPQIT